MQSSMLHGPEERPQLRQTQKENSQRKVIPSDSRASSKHDLTLVLTGGSRIAESECNASEA